MDGGINMFGINKLKNEIKELKKAIEDMPAVKVCSECGSVRAAREFNGYREGIFSYQYEKTHCNACDELVEKKNKAIALAQADPDKIIKCVKSKSKK